MPRGLSYPSFERAVGELCPGGRSSLAYTNQGRLWKDGFFSVASKTWFLALSRAPDFGARSEDIRARLKSDRLHVQRVADSVVDEPDGLTFALFAETLVRQPFFGFPPTKQLTDENLGADWQEGVRSSSRRWGGEGRPATFGHRVRQTDHGCSGRGASSVTPHRRSGCRLLTDRIAAHQQPAGLEPLCDAKPRGGGRP